MPEQALQLRLALGVEFAGGGASYLFWRNPETALVGLYGSLARRDASDATNLRLGLEAHFDTDLAELALDHLRHQLAHAVEERLAVEGLDDVAIGPGRARAGGKGGLGLLIARAP